jgi:holo-[acyl-carrier protein] synthase
MIVGTGFRVIDLTYVSQSLERDGSRFVTSVYSYKEQAIGRSEANLIQFYAGRLAAKKACSAALSVRADAQITWTEYEIHRDERGCPLLLLSGDALVLAQRLAGRNCGFATHVSISHDGKFAAAFVVMERVADKRRMSP